LPGAVWQAHVLDAGAIATELNGLWRRFSGGDGPVGGDPAHPPEENPNPASSVQMRASTLNLVAVARSRTVGTRIEDAVTHLSDLYPSRATILIADPDRADDTDPGLDVRVALLEQPGEKGRPAVRFECVTVEVGANNERYLASIASPLLVADLPDFLWWAGNAVAGSDLFKDLVEVSDRLILDSAGFGDPARELRHLASLLTRTQGCPKMSDFTWARITPWRQLITQFFDPPSSRAALDALDRVVVTYGAADADGRSGLSGALLLAGWLGSRLDWRAPGELLPVLDQPGAWRMTLRAGGRGRRREVSLLLRPTPTRLAERCLGEVLLSADGGAAGEFRVERIDPLGLATASEGPGMPAVRRMVFSGLPDDAALLADELRMFGRDPDFEAALTFAATVAPASDDGGVGA
jgi:hypothetical protein